MIPKKALVAITTIVLAGCGTVAEVARDIDTEQSVRHTELKTPFRMAQRSRVIEVPGAFVPVTAMTSLNGGLWLRTKMVSLDIKKPTPLAAIVSKFAEQGLNIASDLPLDRYTYVGRVNRTDADTALKTVLGSLGLDYQVDDSRQLITIRPVATKSWTLNIGNRRTSFATSSNENTAFESDDSSGVYGNNGAAGRTGSTPAQSSNSRSSSNSSGSSADGQGTSVQSSDDFWSSLSKELEARLTIQVPSAASTAGAMAANIPPPLPGATPMVPGIEGASYSMLSTSGTESYAGQKLGSFSINPETGAVSVQAPQWVLSELDTYFKNVQEMYNTNISFAGEIILVTTSRGDSEGFDLSGFAQWAGGKYGAIITNNALGGVTVSMPEGGGVPAVAASAQGVAGPLIGGQYRSGENALNIFNAYLSEVGKVSVIQKPRITTTSGVPGVFRRKYVDYYNDITQEAAAGGTGSAITATKNQIIPVETGIDLRVNPRVDVSTGLIRVQLSLNQIIRSGTRVLSQMITFGNNAQSVNTAIPLLTKQNSQGEVLLRDGDMIIIGGQTEDSMTVDENGLPGGASGPLGGFFGVKAANREQQTYYFALRVTVNKRQ